MKFNPNRSIKNQDLSEKIVEIFKNKAEFFLEELMHQKLEVILIDAPYSQYEGHKIRAVVNENPKWYKHLYRKYYPNFRRDRTLKSLKRLAELKDKNFVKRKYKYDAIFREFIYEILINGYYSKNYLVYPINKEVEEYFRE
jgi:hypothetical protein